MRHYDCAAGRGRTGALTRAVHRRKLHVSRGADLLRFAAAGGQHRGKSRPGQRTGHWAGLPGIVHRRRHRPAFPGPHRLHGHLSRDGAAVPPVCLALFPVRARAADAERRLAGQGRAAARFRRPTAAASALSLAGRAISHSGRGSASRRACWPRCWWRWPAGSRRGGSCWPARWPGWWSRWCCCRWSGRRCTRPAIAAWRAFWSAASSTPIRSTR